MFGRSLAFAFLFLLTLSVYALAETAHIVGGDRFLRGQNSDLNDASPRDVFVSGFNATISAPVEKDAHVAGFNATVSAPIAQDLYAVGFNINISKPVGDDLSVAGFDVNLHRDASVTGNVRLMGNAVTINATIQGSLVAAATDLNLNSTVLGDADLTIGKIEFGPDARIGGKLTYHATEPLDIPTQVVPADRVQFEQLPAKNAAKLVPNTLWDRWVTLQGIFFGLAITFGFFVLVAAMFFSLAPKLVERVRTNIAASTLGSLILGAIAMSACIGFIPVAAITVVGIPLIPFAALACVFLWITGYVFGTFSLASQIYERRQPEPLSTWGRSFLVLVAMVLLSLLNFIPFLGWIINLGVMLIGLGGLAGELVQWLPSKLGTQPR